ncbi:MAG: heme ABC transporter ATP-binding protein CcmA [Firmicutes bacterium]|nr:heme ABC transporter ATP-binding protein CcmA [Bacillota bacterium]
MISLRSVINMNNKKSNRFPFNIPTIKNLEIIELSSPVTILVGENGSGKSTFLEALASNIGLPSIGGESLEDDMSLSEVRELSKCLRLVWNINKHRGFFLRAEDFFNFTKRISKMKVEMHDRLKEIDHEYKDRSNWAYMKARSPFVGTIYELENKYGEDLDANSHGESFLKLFEGRFVPEGLYILDEPEAPLSPLRQLTLISMIKDMVNKGCQFIIATHSPILMAIPDADIISFDQIPIERMEYDELEHVKLTRDFLNNPKSFLRHL